MCNCACVGALSQIAILLFCYFLDLSAIWLLILTTANSAIAQKLRECPSVRIRIKMLRIRQHSLHNTQVLHCNSILLNPKRRQPVQNHQAVPNYIRAKKNSQPPAVGRKSAVISCRNYLQQQQNHGSGTRPSLHLSYVH